MGISRRNRTIQKDTAGKGRLARRKGSALLYAIEAMEPRTFLTVNAWAAAVSGDFDTPSMWSLGHVPRSTEDAVINVPGSYTVTHSSFVTDSINSLLCSVPFTLSAGTLNVATTLEVDNTFTLAGGTLAGGTVQPGSGGQGLSITSGTLSGVTLAANTTFAGNGSMTVENGLTLDSSSLTVAAASSGMWCQVFFQGTQTLGGTGQVIFAGSSSQNYLQPVGGGTPATGATLTIGPDIVLSGSQNGFVSGYNAYNSLNNEGTINANTLGRTITVGGGMAWTNAGTLECSNSGTLDIAGTLDNTGQTLGLAGNNGPVNLGGNGTIQGGILAAIGGSQLNANGITLSGVTLGSNLTVNGAGINVANDLTLSNSSLTLSSTATECNISFEGTQNLAGDGQVIFAGSSANQLCAQGGGTAATAATLTIGANIAINESAGTGTICGTSNYDSVVNQGQITSTKYILINSASFGTFTNTGTIQAVNGGQLQLQGTWSNSGTLTAGNGSTINLAGNFSTPSLAAVSASGGTINVVGTVNNVGASFMLGAAAGTWNLAGGTIQGGTVAISDPNFKIQSGTFSSVTLASNLSITAGQLAVQNGLTLSLSASITINNHAYGSYSELIFQGTQQLSGTGSIVLGEQYNGPIIYAKGDGGANPATLTLGSGIVISQLTGAPVSGGPDTIEGYYAGDSIVNQGTIMANVSSGFVSISGLAANTGVLSASNGATLIVAATGNLGAVQLSGSQSTLTLNGTNYVNNLGLTIPAGDTLNIGGVVSTAGLGTINASAGTVNVNGTVNNAGATLTLTSVTGSWNFSNATIQGGTITASGATFILSGGDTLQSVNVAAVLSLAANGTIGVNNTFNAVTLSANLTVPASTLTVQNGLTLSGGATITLSADSSTLTFQGSQTLGGNGSVNLRGDIVSMGDGGSNPAALTIGSGVTITQTTGSIANLAAHYASDSLVNQGTIVADVAYPTLNIDTNGGVFANVGTLEIINGAQLAIAGSWSSAGTVSASSGTLTLGGTFATAGLGTMNASGATVNITGTLNNAGAILALTPAAGTWNLQYGATIVGGTIGGAGLGLNMYGGTLNGVTFQANATLLGNTVNVLNGLTLLSGASITLSLPGGGSGPQLLFAGNQMLGGNGAVLLGNASSITAKGDDGSNPATLTIGNGVTISQVASTIGGNIGGYYSNDSVINLGAINANLSGSTQYTAVTLNGKFTNFGTLAATNGGTLALNGTWANSGTLTASGGTVNLGGTFSIPSIGTINSGGGTVNIIGTLNNVGTTLALTASTGSWNLAGGTIQGGTVTASGASLNLIGSLNLNGNSTLSGVILATNLSNPGYILDIQNGLTLSNGATITLNSSMFVNGLNDPELIFLGTQTLGGNGSIILGGTYLAPYIFAETTDGITPATLTIGAGVTISQMAGATRNGYLTGYSRVNIVNQGTILANTPGLAITVSATLDNKGTIEAAPGVVSIYSGSTLNLDTGSLSVGIGGSVSGTTYGQIQVTTGAVALNGTLNAILLNGFVPYTNETFIVLSYTSDTGSFAAFGLNPPGAIFTPAVNTTNLVLTGNPNATIPSVVLQPQNAAVAVGATASFTAVASGNPAPTVQWQVSTDGGHSWTPLNGATSTTYVSAPTASADNGDQFEAAFTNAGGSTTTSAATLTVINPVSVTSVVINGNDSALAGAQRSMVDSIVYTFSEAVNLAATGAFTIAVHTGEQGTVPGLAWTAINPDGNGASTQWVVTFTGASVIGNSIANGVYDITLNVSAVTSEANPAAIITPRATDTFYRLYGDYNGDQVVNATDNLHFKNAITTYNPIFDYDNNGAVNATDNLHFKASISFVFNAAFTTTI